VHVECRCRRSLKPPLAFDVLDWEIARRESEEYLTRKHAHSPSTGSTDAEASRGVAQGRPAARVLSLEQELSSRAHCAVSRGAGSTGHVGLGATAQQVVGGVRAPCSWFPQA